MKSDMKGKKNLYLQSMKCGSKYGIDDVIHEWTTVSLSPKFIFTHCGKITKQEVSAWSVYF